MINNEKAILELSYLLGMIDSEESSNITNIDDLRNSITRAFNNLSRIYYIERNSMKQSQFEDEIYEQYRR